MKKPTSEKQYYENAQKSCPWPITIEDKYISVSQEDLEQAESHLMVRHLIGKGFKIQLAIGIEKKEIYDPEIRTTAPTRTKAEIEEFPTGSRYKVVSTGVVLELTQVKTSVNGKRLSKPVFEFNYETAERQPVTCYKENLEQNLKFGSWIKI